MGEKNYTTRKTSLDLTIQVTKFLGNLISDKILYTLLGLGFIGTIFQLEFMAIASFLLATVALLLERLSILKVKPIEERTETSFIDKN